MKLHLHFLSLFPALLFEQHDISLASSLLSYFNPGYKMDLTIEVI